MKMDLSIFRRMMMSNSFDDLSCDLKNFDNQECYFYYDESNNIRKLWLAEDDFDAPVDRDFVLGGVLHFGQSCNANVDELKSELRLQKSAKELKFKHICKCKDFIECLAEHKVRLFLQWLDQSELYVHCSNINNLFWAIVDIVDSIDEPAYIPLNRQMKNELYRIARSYYYDFYQLLVTCNYPNIAPENIALFYQSIIDFIERTESELPFETEFLRQGLKSARRQNKLTFLEGNIEKSVIDSYFWFYLRPVGVFSSAQHIFDNEYQIEEQFNKYDLFHGSKKVDNCCFVNSKDNQFVQISDCIVGLLGKYYTYVNNLTVYEAHRLFETISAEQKDTLKLLARVINKSESLSKLLFNSIESIEEHEISAYILARAL